MLRAFFKYIAKLLTAPYALLLFVRHKLYDFSILHSEKAEGIFTIVVGNLSVGGTGKTPMVKFLAQNLSSFHTVAVLSRGYGRKSKGFFEVSNGHDVQTFGDESIEIKRGSNVRVFVCEDRLLGLQKIKMLYPLINVVILDDALQHRRLKANLKILLTPYNKPFFNDLLLPFGSLRDLAYRAKFCDMFVVSKSPPHPQYDDFKKLEQHKGFTFGENVFFTEIRFGELIHVNSGQQITHQQLTNYRVFGISAIAQPKPFETFLKSHSKSSQFIRKADHSFFSAQDLTILQRFWDGDNKNKSLIVCTEKDQIKLAFAKQKYGCNFEFYTLPIESGFLNNTASVFLETIEKKIKNTNEIGRQL